MPPLRIDFILSCLAELQGKQNTSSAFAQSAALIQTTQIKQKIPSLPPVSQDTKDFAEDDFCMDIESQFLSVNLDFHQLKCEHFSVRNCLI